MKPSKVTVNQPNRPDIEEIKDKANATKSIVELRTIVAELVDAVKEL